MKINYISVLLILILALVLASHTQAEENPQWNLPEGAIFRLGKGQFNEMAYSPDGTHLAVASAAGIWIYDLETLQALNLLTTHTGGILDVSYSPNGKTIAGVGGNGTVQLWDVTMGSLQKNLTGHRDLVWSVAFSP